MKFHYGDKGISKITWNGMESKQEQYPIEWIPINLIRFSVESVPYNTSGLKFSDYSDNLCYEAMQKIPNMDPVEAVKVLEDTIIDEGFDHFNELDKIHARMCLVYTSIKKTMNMLNPLIVQKRNNKYYLIVGRQRLCALKMLEHQGSVPCRVLGPNDSLSTEYNPAIQKHPYIKTNDLYKEV